MPARLKKSTNHDDAQLLIPWTALIGLVSVSGTARPVGGALEDDRISFPTALRIT